MPTISTDSYYVAEKLLNTLINKYSYDYLNPDYVNSFIDKDYKFTIYPNVINLLKAYSQLRDLVTKDISDILRIRHNNRFTSHIDGIGVYDLQESVIFIQKIYRTKKDIWFISNEVTDRVNIKCVKLWSLIQLLKKLKEPTK